MEKHNCNVPCSAEFLSVQYKLCFSKQGLLDDWLKSTVTHIKEILYIYFSGRWFWYNAECFLKDVFQWDNKYTFLYVFL